MTENGLLNERQRRRQSQIESRRVSSKLPKIYLADLAVEDRLACFSNSDHLDSKSRETLHLLLRDWFNEVENEEADSSRPFASPIVEAQVKLTEAIQMTQALPLPNKFMTALASNMLAKLIPTFGEYGAVMRDLHECVFHLIYDEETQLPFFELSSLIRKEIDNLEAERKSIASRHHGLKEQQQKQDDLVASTNSDMKRGEVRRIFFGWRDLARAEREHRQKMQTLVSKWWRGDDLLQWYFQQWQSFVEEEIKSRIANDLQRTNMDLAHHERLVEEKRKKLDKYLSQLKSLQQEYASKCLKRNDEAATVEKRNEETEAINADIRQLNQVVSKLQQFVESLGYNVVKLCTSQLKNFTKVPDTKGLEDKGDDVLLQWLRGILSKLYEKDPTKSSLLSNVKSLDKLVQLGMIPDLVNCIPASVKLEAASVSNDDILFDPYELDGFNKDHVAAMSTLSKCSLALNHPHKAKKLQLKGGQPARDGSFRLGQHGSFKRDGSFHRDGSFKFGHESPTSNSGKHSEQQFKSMKARRTSFLLVEEHQNQRQNDRKGSISFDTENLDSALLAAIENLQQNGESFLDESLPLVGMEELLTAVSPDGEPDSIFLQVFLRNFALLEPLLPPLESEDSENFKRLGENRNQLAEVIESVDWTKLSSPSILDSDEGPVSNEPNARELLEKIRGFEMKWKVMLNGHKSVVENFQANKSWQRFSSEMESHVWRSLSQAGSSPEVQNTNNSQSPFKQFLTELENQNMSQHLHHPHIESHQVSKHGILEAVNTVFARRYRNKSSGEGDEDGAEEFNPLEYLEKLVGENLVRNIDLLSLLMKRYTPSGCVLDILKETTLLDAEKFASKKLKPKLLALHPHPGDKLKLEHVVEVLLFATEQYHEGAIIDESFAETLDTKVLQKLSGCKALFSKELFFVNVKHLLPLRFLFEKFQTKTSPAGLLSAANWRSLMDHRKGIVSPKHSLSRGDLVDLFGRCNTGVPYVDMYSSQKGKAPSHALCFTEFLSLVCAIARVKNPNPLISMEDKIDDIVLALTSKKE